MTPPINATDDRVLGGRQIDALMRGEPRPQPGLLESADRQREVLALLVRGLSTREIAEVMRIAPNTVKTHLKHIYARFGVSSRGQVMDLLRGGGPPPTQ
ncbi:LuxR C-terminal-related transcriptional regulator [Streptosporangium sp. V21-05]|uniref:helix-turn-helix domain-containing protein n=1 Tax=Streptosporangium sp. V21-05 TaxID=3446115 RepID=UPI003F5387AC